MKALVLAAGEGTRLRPLTLETPKSLLEVSGRPILSHILSALEYCGIKDITILVGHKKEKIMQYYGRGSDGLKIGYVVQEKREGTASAVGYGEKTIHEPFVCINGDVLVSKSDIGEMIKLFEKTGKMVMAVTKVDHPERFGVVEMAGGRLERIVEKPKQPKSNLINAGLFVFTPAIFEEIRKTPKSVRGEYEITDTLTSLAKKQDVLVYTIKDYWIDIGVPQDLEKASRMLPKS